MARRKSDVAPVEFSHGEPPPELCSFVPGPDGWTAEDFAAFLRTRAAWRDTHANPLPALPTLERHYLYLNRQGVPAPLIEAEQAAPKAAAGTRGEIGRLPAVVRPTDTHGLPGTPEDPA